MMRAADSLARQPGQGPDRRRTAIISRQVTRAYLALARRDTAAAMAALDAIPDTVLGGDLVLRPYQSAALCRTRPRFRRGTGAG